MLTARRLLAVAGLGTLAVVLLFTLDAGHTPRPRVTVTNPVIHASVPPPVSLTVKPTPHIPPVVVEPTVTVQPPTRVITAHATRTVARTTRRPHHRAPRRRRRTPPRGPSIRCGVLPLPPGLC